jgi:hypothetical protein
VGQNNLGLYLIDTSNPDDPLSYIVSGGVVHLSVEDIQGMIDDLNAMTTEQLTAWLINRRVEPDEAKEAAEWGKR